MDRAPPRRPLARPGRRPSACGAGRRRRPRASRPRRTNVRRPVERIWSIVCPAPTSRSSGGRSEVSTISGTPAWSASTTAGWRLAAAEPLVQATTAGAPVASAAPSAMNPRSARRGRRQLERLLALEGERERGGARAGGEEGVANAAAGELVDERRGERGVAVGPVDQRTVDRSRRPHSVLVHLDAEPRLPAEQRRSPIARRASPTLSANSAGREPVGDSGRTSRERLRGVCAAAIPSGLSSALER